MCAIAELYNFIYLSIMAPKRKATAKTDRKVRAKRKSYSIKIKTLARAWRSEDKLTNAQIKKQL